MSCRRFVVALAAALVALPQLAGAQVVAERIEAPFEVVAGTEAEVTHTLRNVGDDFVEVEYVIVASANVFLSPADLLLLRDVIRLGPGEALERTDVFEVPPSLPAGVWLFGIIPDPASVVGEATNGLLADWETIAYGRVEIVQRKLPPVVVGNFVSIRIYATGGDGVYEWSWAKPPPGLQLVEEEGMLLLVGTPAEPGTYLIDVEVRSRGSVDAATLVLDVGDPDRLVLSTGGAGGAGGAAPGTGGMGGAADPAPGAGGAGGASEERGGSGGGGGDESGGGPSGGGGGDEGGCAAGAGPLSLLALASALALAGRPRRRRGG